MKENTTLMVPYSFSSSWSISGSTSSSVLLGNTPAGRHTKDGFSKGHMSSWTTSPSSKLQSDLTAPKHLVVTRFCLLFTHIQVR